MEKAGLTLRVDLGRGRAVGPGKISIIQAGRDLGLSYLRAWRLINDLNNSFRFPVIEAETAETGGIGGGGTRLTPFGRKLVQLYHTIEAEALAATRKHRRKLPANLNAYTPGLRNSIRRPLSNHR